MRMGGDNRLGRPKVHEDSSARQVAYRKRRTAKLKRYDTIVLALQKIKRDEGRVCDDFELCKHQSCASSYGAWAIADKCLASLEIIV